jgi:hypothetical protein
LPAYRPFAEHLSDSSKGIERAAKADNEAVGRFDGRILPTARWMAELGVADGASIDPPARVEPQIRQPANGNGSQRQRDSELVSAGETRSGGRVASYSRGVHSAT